MQSFNVKIVIEYTVVQELYGPTPSLNMKVSSILAISVTIKLQDRII